MTIINTVGIINMGDVQIFPSLYRLGNVQGDCLSLARTGRDKQRGRGAGNLFKHLRQQNIIYTSGIGYDAGSHLQERDEEGNQ